MVTVAMAQVRVDDAESAADRVERVVRWVTVETEARGSVELVLFPELWSIGAFSVDRALAAAEPIGGPFTQAMSSFAAATGTVVHAGSFPESHPGGVSNTSVVFGPDGSLLATYRKIHLFGFDAGEAVRIAPGHESVVVRTPLGVTGLTTCYDLRFPELYRELVDQGAAAYLIPAGWPRARMSHWRLLSHSRAVENQAVVMACNAVGTTNGIPMGGGSVVVSATGETLGRSSDSEEQYLAVTLDLSETGRWRAAFPALKDRRSVGESIPQRGVESTGG